MGAENLIINNQKAIGLSPMSQNNNITADESSLDNGFIPGGNQQKRANKRMADFSSTIQVFYQNVFVFK